ncbi:MAG: hypothetical protein KDJ47_13580 [Hyphomicrobiaceae bacterium]|nr:hypothetical protein [Hyphomicrobiaceae bacterium]
MAASEEIRAELMKALDAALAGRWEEAHEIVQRYETSPVACWLHAVLHKMEGDASNARYWYARTHMDYERFPDPKAELRAIHHELAHET